MTRQAKDKKRRTPQQKSESVAAMAPPAPRTQPHTATRLSEKVKAAKKLAMVDALGKVGNVRGACALVGIGRRTHYDWIDDDPDYVSQCQDAGEDFADRLEAEAYRRGVVGDERPIMYKGKVVGRVHERSDVLLLAALKATRPEKYRDRFDINLSKLSDDELLQIAREKGINIRSRGDLRALGPAPPATDGSEPGSDPKPN